MHIVILHDINFNNLSTYTKVECDSGAYFRVKEKHKSMKGMVNFTILAMEVLMID